LLLNGISVSSILEGQRTFDLYVRLDKSGRENLKSIQNMLVDAPNLKRKIPIRSVAQVSIQDEPYSINRENVQRLTIISFNVQGRDLGSVINEVQQKIQEKIKLPSGYYIEYSGQFETQQQANRVLIISGCLMLLITLVLLHQVFGNFRESLLVIINVPLALIGGIISLFISGATISVAALIGFITLFGIAMRNGIILVTHYNQLHKEGKPLRQVVIQGTLDRLVPVLMTAATAALGLIPLLWGSPTGKELERPLAQVLIGGLFTSTLLNMVVVPTVYLRMEQWRKQHFEKKNQLTELKNTDKC
jgi:Cu/Ag efflux pump CusA